MGSLSRETSTTLSAGRDDDHHVLFIRCLDNIWTMFGQCLDNIKAATSNCANQIEGRFVKRKPR
jgi:hypothetical protein